MPIFIAKTYDGYIESVVLAKNEDLASAFWQGKGIYAHSIRVVCEEDIDDHITGIMPIVNTIKKNLSYQGSSDRETLVIAK